MLIALAIAIACGRIGFEPARDGSSDDVAASFDAIQPGDDAALDDAALEDAAAACGWQPCTSGSQACCVGAEGMCVAAGTCTGIVYACDSSLPGRCMGMARCCAIPGGGSRCIPINTACDPQ